MLLLLLSRIPSASTLAFAAPCLPEELICTFSTLQGSPSISTKPFGFKSLIVAVVLSKISPDRHPDVLFFYSHSFCMPACCYLISRDLFRNFQKCNFQFFNR